MPPASMESLARAQVVDRFKQFYKNLVNIPLDDIENVYHPSVVFKDPVHEVHGINNLHNYMDNLCSGLRSGRFQYLDEIISDRTAYIKWNMYFRHSKLGEKEIVVRGVTQIQFDEQIYYHEDIYDMGEMLYEHVPLFSAGVRWLKRRLAA